jgi:hypothetical protein
MELLSVRMLLVFVRCRVHGQLAQASGDRRSSTPFFANNSANLLYWRIDELLPEGGS